MTGVPNQSTCVRKLGADYISVGSELSIISQPDQPWERSEVPVQEGAAAYGYAYDGAFAQARG